MLSQFPVIQEMMAEARQEAVAQTITTVLTGRFGPPGEAIRAGLALVKDATKLERLSLQAGACDSLQAFEQSLRDELPPPPPASTRGRRKPRKPAG